MPKIVEDFLLLFKENYAGAKPDLKNQLKTTVELGKSKQEQSSLKLA